MLWTKCKENVIYQDTDVPKYIYKYIHMYSHILSTWIGKNSNVK